MYLRLARLSPQSLSLSVHPSYQPTFSTDYECFRLSLPSTEVRGVGPTNIGWNLSGKLRRELKSGEIAREGITSKQHKVRSDHQAILEIVVHACDS